MPWAIILSVNIKNSKIILAYSTGMTHASRFLEFKENVSHTFNNYINICLI